jgi:hypothetical protein
MIGFNHLGLHGRLGNQMFQYSTLEAIATYHKYEFCIPYSEFKDEWKDHQLSETFELSNAKHVGHVECFGNFLGIYPEKTFSYDETYVQNCPDNVSIFGYFQTEKYFENISDVIRDDFKFKSEIINTCREFISQVSNPIALHVRRTDYVEKSQDHPPCSLDYYSKALSNFDKDREVIIFSDDPEWCKQQELFSSDRFLVAEGNDNRYDMCLMSMCDDFVIANSSFSWWGAWLANRGTVIAPSRWFGDTGYTANNNTKDIIPDRWIKL